MHELVVRYSKEAQGTNLLMELNGLVRHVCINGIEFLRRHGSHAGDVWMVQFWFPNMRVEEFFVVDESTERAAQALAYMFLGEIPRHACAVKLNGEAAVEVRRQLDECRFVV